MNRALPFATLALAIACTSSLRSQSWSHLSFGEQREVEIWQDPANPQRQKIWVAEDGGRIRHGVRVGSTTTWSQQTTPASIRTPLLDVFFLKGLGLRGIACGLEGRVIVTIDGGTTWIERPQVYANGATTPATLWGAHAFTNGMSLLAGVGVLHYSHDGGGTWTRATVNPGTGGHYQFQTYYSFDFVLDANGSPRHGVVTAKPADILHTQDGMLWTRAQMFDLNGQPAVFPAGYELWDVAFEPNPANPDAARGYVAGGPNPTRLFRTDDSGLTWHEEPTITNPLLGHNTLPQTIPYGVAAWGTDEAIAVGYGGMILRRKPNLGGTGYSWQSIVPNLPQAICDLDDRFSGPIVGADATADGRVWLAGSFGYLRAGDLGFNHSLTSDALLQDTVQNAAMWRLTSCAFDSTAGGFVTHQTGIGHTADGGVTWSIAECTYQETAMNDIAVGQNGEIVAVGKAANATSASALFYRGGVWKRSGLNGIDLRAVAAGYGVFAAVSADGTIWMSRDGGESFGLGGAIPSVELRDIVLTGPTQALVVGRASFATPTGAVGAIYATADMQNWYPVPASGATAPLCAIAARINGPAVELVAVGERGVTLASNGGPFSPIAGFPTTTTRLRAVALPPNSNRVFVGGDFGWMSMYDGTAWAMQPSRTSKDVRGFFFRDGNFGYAACSSGIDTSDTASGSVANGCVIQWR